MRTPTCNWRRKILRPNRRFTSSWPPCIGRRARQPMRSVKCRCMGDCSGKQARRSPDKQVAPAPSRTMRIDSSLGWSAMARLLLIAVFLSHGSAASQTTAVREYDANCARCHGDIYRTYLTTPMANASGPAVEKLIPGGFAHEPSGIDYKVALLNGQAILTTHHQHDSGASDPRQLNY